IDTQGDWVIEAQFDRAGDFVDAGLAVVAKDSHWQLIDLHGQAVAADRGAPVKLADISDGLPARVQISYYPGYQRLDRQPLTPPAGVTILGDYGDHGLLLARKDGRYGLLAHDMSWRLKPVYDDIDSGYGAGSVARLEGGPDGPALIDGDGRIIAKDFYNARQLRDLWLVRHDD